MELNTKQLFAWETDESNQSAFDTFEESPIACSACFDSDFDDDKENINPFTENRMPVQRNIDNRGANRMPLGDITHLFKRPQDDSSKLDDFKMQFKVKQMTKAIR
jgi:hypothetical protein